jgi:hypothetical protein
VKCASGGGFSPLPSRKIPQPVEIQCGGTKQEVRRDLDDGIRRTGSQQYLAILAFASNLPVGIARTVPVQLHGRFRHEKRLRNCSISKGIF